MNITPNAYRPVAPQPQTAEATAKKEFNYNSQDPDTLPSETTTIGVDAKDGKVETESVVLHNRKALILFGQLLGIKEDPDFKLNPNADGNFVFPQNHKSFTSANAFAAAAATVDKYNEVYKDLTGKSIEWAFESDKLKVSPETGKWPNAFYARELEGVHFFDVKHTSTGDSGEVASHEVGHAVLDAIRPNYFEGTGAETGAFHEAFGDVLAMLMTLGSDTAVDAIVNQTEAGDLSSKKNILSEMGEGFGQALGLPGGIRSSFNQFTWQDPTTLPERGDDNNLGHEVHDFSRLWSGAFYDVLDGISDANRAAGMSPQEALKAAGEEGWKLLIGQMEFASKGSETTFKEMATNLLAGDAQFNGGQRQDLIRDIMEKRDLLPAGAGLFKSAGPVFSGKVKEKEITLDEEFGALAGVKMNTLVDQPVFGFGPMSEAAPSADEAKKGVKLMLQNDRILFTDTKPSFADFFKPDGTAYQAYVMPGPDGERVLQRVPMAVCDFGHGHIHGNHNHGGSPVHDHGHSHLHGENCDHGHIHG